MFLIEFVCLVVSECDHFYLFQVGYSFITDVAKAADFLSAIPRPGHAPCNQLG